MTDLGVIDLDQHRITGAVMKLCACGCGLPTVSPRATYRQFHYERSPAGKAAQSRGGKLSAAMKARKKAARTP